MKPQTIVEKLTLFVNQNPGLDIREYSDSKSYQAEMKEITKDRNDFFELLSLFLSRYEGKANDALTEYLTNSSGRLTLKNGRIDYVTGQYWPVEYRPAANRVLASLIWQHFRDEFNPEKNQPTYKDGHAIRKALEQRGVSNRVMENYFN